MNRGFILGVIAMAAIVVISNILVQYLLGNWLTWGAFTYPFAFLVTDIMNRLYGASNARKVVLVGFVVGVISSFIGTQIVGEFGPLVTLRIAIGSGVAFLVAQLVDVFVSWAGEMIPMLGLGPVVPLWVSLAVADWFVKLSLALIALIPFRMLVNKWQGTTA